MKLSTRHDYTGCVILIGLCRSPKAPIKKDSFNPDRLWNWHISYLLVTMRCLPGVKGTGAWRNLSCDVINIQIFVNYSRGLFLQFLKFPTNFLNPSYYGVYFAAHCSLVGGCHILSPDSGCNGSGDCLPDYAVS